MGLAPGSYTATITAVNPEGRVITFQRTVTIARAVNFRLYAGAGASASLEKIGLGDLSHSLEADDLAEASKVGHLSVENAADALAESNASKIGLIDLAIANSAFDELALEKLGTLSVADIIEGLTGAEQYKFGTQELDELAEVMAFVELNGDPIRLLPLSAVGSGSTAAEIVKIGHLDVPLTTQVQSIADVTKLSTWALSESAVTDSTAEVERGPTILSAIETAELDTSATLVKVVNVTGVDLRLTASVSALMSGSLSLPLINLPATDIQSRLTIAGASGVNELSDEASDEEQSMNIELYQGGFAQLKFPITINGQSVPAISDAKLVLFRGTEEALALNYNIELFFQNSEVTAVLDESNTVNLTAGYQFELWVVDLENNPLYVNGGKITFNPTKVRF